MKKVKRNAIQAMVFENPEFGRIRTTVDAKGEPLFCGKDVCEALGYRKTNHAIHQHVSPHEVLKQDLGVPTGKKADGSMALRSYLMLFVTESGLYSLIFGSKLDSAQRFKSWVTSVVLPQIRKTGGYVPVAEGDTDEDVRQRTGDILQKTLQHREALISQQKKLLGEQTARIEQLNRQVDEQVVELQKSGEEIVCLEHDVKRLMSKAFYTDTVLNSISCYTTTQVAKELGITAQELNRALCALHVQYYQSGQYMLYADFAHCGFAKSRTEGRRDEYSLHTRTYLVWTERGREFIHRLKLNIFQVKNERRP